MGMNGAKKLYGGSKAIMAMLLVQIFTTGMQLLSKIVLNRGTFIFALMAYRHMIAALCVAPFALYFERGNAKKLNRRVFLWLFLSALTGSTGAMAMYYYGLGDTTAAYASNFLNLVPIFTFIFCIILRMEKLELTTRAGRVKIGGAILCFGGALITSLYKGKTFYIRHHHIAPHDHIHVAIQTLNKTHWSRGTLLLLGSGISYGTWFVVQGKLLKVFPTKYWVTMLTCVIACLQSTLLGMCLDRNKAAWKLGWDLQLVTIVYSGVVATAATFCLITWAISKKGPTYPPMFNPLSLIFVAISEAIILGEKIRVGNIVGTVVIITGLYSFLWGKTKEMKKSAHLPRTAAAVEAATSTTSDCAAVQAAAVAPSVSPTPRPRPPTLTNNAACAQGQNKSSIAILQAANPSPFRLY